MRLKSIKFVGFAIAMVLLSGTAFADTLYQENFDAYPNMSPPPAPWSYYGSWFVFEGALMYNDDLGGEALHEDGYGWSDYLFECDANVAGYSDMNPYTTEPTLWIGARVQPMGEGYYARIYPQWGGIDLMRDNGGSLTWLGVGFPGGSGGHIGMLMTGSVITVLFNGSPLITVTDSGPGSFTSGTIAFRGAPNSWSIMDNVNVDDGQFVPEPSSLAVLATGVLGAAGLLKRRYNA